MNSSRHNLWRKRLSRALCVPLCASSCATWDFSANQNIDRQSLVNRHIPHLTNIDPQSPFTLGNGQFAFTADITGLQSLPELYFQKGIPLETKARWAWHSKANPQRYALKDAEQGYAAYGRQVPFPTHMNSAAGQWLRQNPHDLPLVRIGFVLDEQALDMVRISAVEQRLDLWRGELDSRFAVDAAPVAVSTLVDSARDQLAVRAQSTLLAEGRLCVQMHFPRAYDFSVKNTPDLDWGEPAAHLSKIIEREEGLAVIYRIVDDAEHHVRVRWNGAAEFTEVARHRFVLCPAAAQATLEFLVEYSRPQPDPATTAEFAVIQARTAAAWRGFWQAGAAVDFSGSADPRARELERRVVLSRYLLAAQSRAATPSQETGLTSSSWYGKHHTEMAFWHTAHWILWGNPETAQTTLDWYVEHLPSARSLARYRGLPGARWAKMVGPDNRESPGGNPLIIWNQPQPIHLAELLYRRTQNPELLGKYAVLVEETAAAMAGMLVWNEELQRYDLDPPIWIAQEIYDPAQTRNPAFELAYWRAGLEIAQSWRRRLGQPPHSDWGQKLQKLAPLPIRDDRYVAIESIPDTFDNPQSRQDHPTMLAPLGMLNDVTADPLIMANTLDAVTQTWDWQSKIWGWDYPMVAMTAARLERPQQAVDMLMADLPHNRYLSNGHVPQPGAQLPVYLPANGALLTGVAYLLGGWEGAPPRKFPGFPADGSWNIKAEGFSSY